ncbi:unnamed protein product [Rotaria sp. Silwood2]|nr:unnamed protein product [Rotaria sp. Silwood2]
MSVTNFKTDLFRDLTFDLLSSIANDPTEFDELNDAYLNNVHSRKYEHEKKNKANVRHAVEEQSLSFEVVNNHSLQVRKHSGGQILPTALVFGSDSLSIFIFERGNYVQHLELYLVPVFAYYKSSVCASLNNSLSIKSSPEDLSATSETSKTPKFTYPSNVCITSSEHLCISFTGSNQLIFCEVDGKVLVITLISTRRLGTDKIDGLKRIQQPIASLWDLCITESPCKIYSFKKNKDKVLLYNGILQKNSCSAIIGSGVEENRNSSESMTADLASPHSICNGTMNEESVLFIVDSDSSITRIVTLHDRHVANLIGDDDDPKNLSAFGDLDSNGHNAKLQYPVGIAFHYPSSQLYVTDRFNNKLKRVDIKTLICSSYFVTDTDRKKQRGETNSAKFNEPYGIAIFEHFLFLADKNNSHVKRIDLDQDTIVRVNYIPHDKQIAQLKYEVMVCQDENCSTMNCIVQLANQTNSTIEFTIKTDQKETTNSD